MEPEQSIAQSAEELDRQLARLFYRRMELAALKAREQGENCPVFESEQSRRCWRNWPGRTGAGAVLPGLPADRAAAGGPVSAGGAGA